MSRTFTLLILILAVLVASTACAHGTPQGNTPKIADVNDLTVILHAGGGLGGMRLLNCQEAFEVYYEMGYRYFEYDFKLSSEGKLIGTHSWEHLDGGYDGMPYEEFTALRLEGGYTPVNEDWLVEMLRAYPDVTVIADAKEATTLQDAEVIKRLYALGEMHGIDLSDRIIPEIFSVEMWEAVRETTSFSAHLFSRYKEYYSIETVTASFPTDKFIGIALSYDYLDGYYKRNLPYLQECGYRIFMFDITETEDVLGALALGADTVYVDDTNILPAQSDLP